eukprot:COSAG02_NODE_2529_length_8602_cov_20.688463_5_plen_146_part_00
MARLGPMLFEIDEKMEPEVSLRDTPAFRDGTGLYEEVVWQAVSRARSATVNHAVGHTSAGGAAPYQRDEIAEALAMDRAAARAVVVEGNTNFASKFALACPTRSSNLGRSNARISTNFALAAASACRRQAFTRSEQPMRCPHSHL